MTRRARQPVDARAAYLASKPEDEYLKEIIDEAHRQGWLVAHFRPAMTGRTRVTKTGTTVPVWVTPVQADGKGFPDLVLLRFGMAIAVEVKSETGVVSPEQDVWLKAFNGAGIPAVVWRPRDWDYVRTVLAKREGA